MNLNRSLEKILREKVKVDDYKEYVGSNDWKDLKRKLRKLIEERGKKCEKCFKETGYLQLHHKNYDMEFGMENDEDLLLVCKDCHNELHQDLEIFDNVETVGICPECGIPMKRNKNKFTCKHCGVEIEPKIK